MEGTSEENSSKKPKYSEIPNPNTNSDLYVFPWMGIIANIPTKFQQNRQVGESGNKLKSQLSQFNPSKVDPIWTYKGHSGFAIIHFPKNWYGFKTLNDFETHFEIQKKGKRDYYYSNEENNKEGMYGWIAKEEDYNFGTIPVRKYLKRYGDLKSIGDVQLKDLGKDDMVLNHLASEILEKNRNLQELEIRFLDNQVAVEKIMRERDELIHTCSEEMQKLENLSNDHLRRIMEENSNLRSILESKKKEAQETNQKLLQKKKMSGGCAAKLTKEMNSLELASIEKQRADERVWMLVKEHKKEKEEAMKKILELEKQMHSKQSLELEIHQLRNQLEKIEAQEMSSGLDESDWRDEMERMREELRDKVEELEDIESLNQTLVIKEKRSNDELEEARNELIKGLEGRAIPITIGINRMGEINKEAFRKACEIKFLRSNIENEAQLLLQKWQQEIKNPNWHPFKSQLSNGSITEVINEEDEKLLELKMALGEEAYEAVLNALMEIKEFNPVLKYPVPEIWNFRENRKATMWEAVRFTLNSWKVYRKKMSRN